MRIKSEWAYMDSLTWSTKEVWDLVELGLEHKVDEVMKTDAAIILENKKGCEALMSMPIQQRALLLFELVRELEKRQRAVDDYIRTHGLLVRLGNRKYGWKPFPDE